MGKLIYGMINQADTDSGTFPLEVLRFMKSCWRFNEWRFIHSLK